jgi:hypothetical protein
MNFRSNESEEQYANGFSDPEFEEAEEFEKKRSENEHVKRNLLVSSMLLFALFSGIVIGWYANDRNRELNELLNITQTPTVASNIATALVNPTATVRPTEGADSIHRISVLLPEEVVGFRNKIKTHSSSVSEYRMSGVKIDLSRVTLFEVDSPEGAGGLYQLDLPIDILDSIGGFDKLRLNLFTEEITPINPEDAKDFTTQEVMVLANKMKANGSISFFLQDSETPGSNNLNVIDILDAEAESPPSITVSFWDTTPEPRFFKRDDGSYDLDSSMARGVYRFDIMPYNEVAP